MKTITPKDVFESFSKVYSAIGLKQPELAHACILELVTEYDVTLEDLPKQRDIVSDAMEHCRDEGLCFYCGERIGKGEDCDECDKARLEVRLERQRA